LGLGDSAVLFGRQVVAVSWTADHVAVDRYFDARLKQARWAVRRWAAFPVNAAPRPLVLVGEEVVTRRGFRTGEAKDAFGAGHIDWAVEIPDGVRAKLQNGATSRARARARQPLRITHAGAGEQEFMTDRGLEILPAWWVQGPATVGPIWVLDPAVEHWRPPKDAAGAPPPAPTQGQPLVGPVELYPDGQSLVIPWLGSAPQVETFSRAELIETPTAVSAVAVRKNMGFEGWVVAVGVRHDVAAHLHKPLGDCVFVDLHGDAVQIAVAL
jgi:hypothetical protein